MKFLLIVLFFLTFFNCTNDISNSFEHKKKTGSNEGIYPMDYSEETRSSELEQYYMAYDRVLSLWPVPYNELTIPTSYGSAHVITSGPENAPPIVLLHGMNSSSTMWYPNIGELSKDHKVYAIDNLTEPGKSIMSRKVNNREDLIDWYIELLDTLEINNFTLIGASKGGWLAVKLALYFQDSVDKLILLSPLQTFGHIPPGTKILSAIRYALNPNRQRLSDVLESMSANVTRLDTLYIDQFYRGTKIAGSTGMLMNFSPFGRKELKTLKMPVLVLIGDQDIINKKSVIEKANEYIPNAETWIIKDAGHFLTVDQSEIINSRIINFLNEQEVTSK